MCGRGIVIPAGGMRYFPCAWVCIRVLRALGCKLPIELWHVGRQELSAGMRALVEPFGVACVDATAVAASRPPRFLSGWPIKSFALMHTGFREVLLLDADNMPVVDPTYLFDTPQYHATGAVFWPDSEPFGPHRAIWRLTGVPYRSELAVESGQMLVDRQRCWPGVALAGWMNNQHADFWYRHLHGDKDTFRFAWRKTGLDYAMPPRSPKDLPDTLLQLDFGGGLLFQHRYGNKWSLDSQTLRIPGFRLEMLCRQFLAELRARWTNRPNPPHRHEDAEPAARAVAESLSHGRWHLESSSGTSTVSFHLDGSVRGGSARERTWSLTVHATEAILAIAGIDSVAWRLARGHNDLWVGQAPAEPGRAVSLCRIC
jgi:hypothetical protein